jgi:hypothetical protein
MTTVIDEEPQSDIRRRLGGMERDEEEDAGGFR